MRWNWQQPDWPDFTWNPTRLARAEERFLLGAGVLIGTAKHLGDTELAQLSVDEMSVEALTPGRAGRAGYFGADGQLVPQCSGSALY